MSQSRLSRVLVRRSLLACATLGTSTVIAIGGAAAASAADAGGTARTDYCDAYRAVNDPPQNWTAECEDDLPGEPADVMGYADPTTKDIKLRRGQDEPTTLHAMGHEYAHAYDAEHLTPAARAWFAHRIGKNVWRDDTDYRNSPNEVFADNLARCTGWHDQDWAYKRVDCATVGEAIARAKGRPEAAHDRDGQGRPQVQDGDRRDDFDPQAQRGDNRTGGQDDRNAQPTGERGHHGQKSGQKHGHSGHGGHHQHAKHSQHHEG